MLNSRKRREGDACDRSIQLLHRQSDKLERPPIQSKRVRSPKPTEEKLLRVPRQEYNETVTGGQSAKMQHRTDDRIYAEGDLGSTEQLTITAAASRLRAPVTAMPTRDQ